MQTVYEIVQDDMPIHVPLFTNLDRAQHELNRIVDEMLQKAQQQYSGVYHETSQSGYDFVVGDVRHIMVNNGLMEYTSLGIYRREVNTATLGDSHS